MNWKATNSPQVLNGLTGWTTWNLAIGNRFYAQYHGTDINNVNRKAWREKKKKNVLSNLIIYQHICLRTSLFFHSFVFKMFCFFFLSILHKFAQQLARVYMGDMEEPKLKWKKKTKKKTKYHTKKGSNFSGHKFFGPYRILFIVCCTHAHTSIVYKRHWNRNEITKQTTAEEKKEK